MDRCGGSDHLDRYVRDDRARRTAEPAGSGYRREDRPRDATRRELTIASAKTVEAALARNGKVTMWASAIPLDIAATLATLPVDVADMFRRHRRMTFPESYIDLAAEFLVEPTPGAVVPAGYVQIGLSHEHSEIVCTSRSSAEVAVSPFDADSPRDRFTSIYHFILCEAAFEVERRDDSLDPPSAAAT
jgi:hypothetical protein